jgi:hypothetical protein
VGQSTAVPFRIIDNAFANVEALAIPAPVFRENIAGLTSAQKANIYHAQAIMRKEALRLLDDVDVDRIDMPEESQILTGLLEDNKFNIGGIITRDGRRMKEQIQRSVTSGLPVSELRNTISNFAITASFYQLSTLAHPRATVRSYMARGVENAVRNGEMDVERIDDQPWTVLPKEAGFSKRVDKELAYRIMTTRELDAKFKNMTEGQMMPDWRGLGLSFNSDEYYIPLFAIHLEAARKWSKEKRREINK